MTYPEPPKKPVLNDIMLKVKGVIEKKHMPFAVVVGDQPVHIPLVQIKSEHLQEYEKIIPFLAVEREQGGQGGQLPPQYLGWGGTAPPIFQWHNKTISDVIGFWTLLILWTQQLAS